MRDDTKCEHGEFTDGCAPCMAECVARLFTAEAERDEARAVNHRSFMRMVEVERLRAALASLVTVYGVSERKLDGVPGWVTSWDSDPDHSSAREAWDEALEALAEVKP
jgi:hypothetical protein